MRTIDVTDLLCPCCGTGHYDRPLVVALNQMQTLVGIELVISSGYRCPKHNAAVGGAPSSQHLTGRAADVHAPGRTPLELYLAADQVPEFAEGGIGLYPSNYVHVDTRPARARWFRVAGKDHPITDYLTRPTQS